MEEYNEDLMKYSEPVIKNFLHSYIADKALANHDYYFHTKICESTVLKQVFSTTRFFKNLDQSPEKIQVDNFVFRVSSVNSDQLPYFQQDLLAAQLTKNIDIQIALEKLESSICYTFNRLKIGNSVLSSIGIEKINGFFFKIVDNRVQEPYNKYLGITIV